jgi:hypothetical protein
MDSHDTIKRMARAWKCIQTATQLTNCPRITDNLNEAERHIYEVGEGRFGAEFINEVKSQYQDS